MKVLHAKASELQALGQLEEALDYYQQSLSIFDDQAITDYCIARILINLGRFSEAYRSFEKILNGHGIGLHDGNDFLWMTDLGYLMVKLGSDEQGANYLQEGLNRMPYSCFAWNALGVAQARQGKLEQALASLTQGLQCDPDSAITWSNMAVVYAYGNAGDQAITSPARGTSLERLASCCSAQFASSQWVGSAFAACFRALHSIPRPRWQIDTANEIDSSLAVVEK